jgi:hypothetical protein
MRECDEAIAKLRLGERLQAVAGKTVPAALKCASALLGLASDGVPKPVVSALERANGDAELRRFVLWLPFPNRRGPTLVASSPEGTSLEEHQQDERAFGWGSLNLLDASLPRAQVLPQEPIDVESPTSRSGHEETLRIEGPFLTTVRVPGTPAEEITTALPRPDEGQLTTVNSSSIVAGRKPKRSTERGEAREKIIAGLTEHHRYTDGS